MNRSAALSAPANFYSAQDTVATIPLLLARGFTRSGIRGQLEARRWQRCGRAIVRHNAAVTFEERIAVGVANCGPRAIPTAFTAAELGGLSGWHRDAVHVLVPAGARICRPAGVNLRVHWCGDWPGLRPDAFGPATRIAYAAVTAATTFDDPRPACGILAAVVQQRLLRPDNLRAALHRHERHRHRHLLLAVVDDIAGGAQALSEIDFIRMCRRLGLPDPVRQSVRADRFGRRRYLDAEWRLADGRVVVVEIDGALHMIYRQWWDDSLRQNELTLAHDKVLRFPSALVRCDDAIVIDQLTRALA